MSGCPRQQGTKVKIPRRAYGSRNSFLTAMRALSLAFMATLSTLSVAEETRAAELERILFMGMQRCGSMND